MGVGWQGGSMEVAERWQGGGMVSQGNTLHQTCHKPDTTCHKAPYTIYQTPDTSHHIPDTRHYIRYRVRPSLVVMLRGPSKEDRGKTRDLG